MPKNIQAKECKEFLNHRLSNYEQSHYAVDPRSLNLNELALLLMEMSPPEDFDWYEKMLENPNLAKFISRPSHTFFNDGMRIFALWLTKTESPNIYTQELFKSELWSKVSVQDKTSFAIELVAHTDPKHVFAKEVLRFFSTLINIPNYFYMTSLWFTAFERNQKQLMNYFLSLPHLNLNQVNSDGETVLDTIKKVPKE